MTIDPGLSPVGVRAQLHQLLRDGLDGDAGPLRSALQTIVDPLDLDAVGMRLRNRRAQEQLADCGLREQRVAVLASSTVHTVANQLTALLVADGTLPQIELAGYNQWRWEILAGAPHLQALKPRLVSCLLDDRAIYERIVDPLDLNEVDARLDSFAAEIAEWVATCGTVLGGLVVLTTIPLNPLRRNCFIDLQARARLDRGWHRMNARLLELADASTVVLSHEAIAVQAGSVFGDPRMRHLAQQVYSPRFLAAWSAEIAAVSRADLGQSAKCLVLDLDNTLWGGVVGDTGISSLALAGSHPGSAHTELQELARDLGRQGVLLAVASKNDDALAREAIATHPEMVLRPDSFLAIRANWQPKPTNLESIAAELNIGIDSLVFLDDNPVERSLMRAMLPEVRTVELPSDAAGFAGALAIANTFVQLHLTDDDVRRTENYRAGAKRAAARSAVASLEEHLAGLDSVLRMESFNAVNADRICALFAKTNQFNLTGRRYSVSELAELPAVYGVRLSDTFGDSGLIAALALRAEDHGRGWAVDNMVVSCRVFSRAVEDAIVTTVLDDAAAVGVDRVTGEYVPSRRNTQFADFYQRLGFTSSSDTPDLHGASRFAHSLTEITARPAWIRMHPDSEAFYVH